MNSNPSTSKYDSNAAVNDLCVLSNWSGLEAFEDEPKVLFTAMFRMPAEGKAHSGWGRAQSKKSRIIIEVREADKRGMDSHREQGSYLSQT
jgi:hypothetical protein